MQAKAKTATQKRTRQRMAELPPGFRFYPTEEELVSFYLLNKLEGNRREIDRVIRVIDIYNVEPWHLPSTHLFHFNIFKLPLIVHHHNSFCKMGNTYQTFVDSVLKK